MANGLEGKTALVTGSSKGIGLACAKTLADRGCRVVLSGRSRQALDAARREMPAGTEAEIAVCDLALDADRAALAARYPDADILVNNAGGIPGGDLFAIDIDRWRDAWQLKMFGYIHLTQLYLAHMRARRSGVVVSIIGDLGRMPRWDYICGSTANAGLIAFTEAVGAQSVDWGVRVLGVNPTMTATDRVLTVARSRAQSQFGDQERWPDVLAGLPFGRLCTPEEVASLVAFLVSPEMGYLSGTVVDLDGGRINRR
jgi:3-oxoacyl-[acyl-carrier protein] reductase